MKTAILTSLLLLAAAAVHAQAPPAPADSTALTMPVQKATPPAYIPPAPTETAAPVTASPEPKRPWLVPARPEVGIRAELDQQHQRVTQSESDMLEAKKALIGDKATLDVKQHEIEALNERIKAAKKAKLDADRKTLDAERKRQELMATFFDRVVDQDDATIEDVSARLDHAKASVSALEQELQFALRMAGVNPKGDPEMLPLEQKVIQAQKDRASAQEKLAQKDQTLAERRLRVYRAWADHIGGK